MSKDEPPQTLQVKIYSPSKVYYDGKAASLSAKNETGPFDILPLHHNFITLLSAGTIVVGTSGSAEQRFDITNGLLHVKDNVATIFIDV